MSTRARGRRTGDSGTRATILAAARESFTARGYDATTVRAIAHQAGVDPALIHYFFGTKDALFAASLELPVNPREVVDELVAGGLDGLGERMVAFLLGVWEEPGGSPLLAMLRSAVAHEEAAAMVRQFLGREVIGRLARAVDAPDPDLRASLCASQIVGLAVARYIVRIEPLASAEAATVAAWVGPTLQRYLTARET